MTKDPLDYIVIGAGPAGVQTSYFLQKAGYNYITLERADAPGAFFTKYPRQRRLISINKVHTGFGKDAEISMRWDWNSLLTSDWETRFADYSQEYFPDADHLPEYLADFTQAHDLNVQCGKDVTTVTRADDGIFTVETDDGEIYRALRVIVSTGRSKPYIPDFPGNDLCMTYADSPDDQTAFANKRVLVVGKGNSAFELADAMIAQASTIYVMSPNPVRLAWKTHYVGHLRALNNNYLDTFSLKSQNTLINAEIEAVRRAPDGHLEVDIAHTNAEGQKRTLHVDEVILCTGFRFDAVPFDDTCTPELTDDGAYPKIHGSWESTNVPDLYFAGALMHSLDYSISTSGFIHGFRYNIKAMADLLAERYHDVPWPSQSTSSDPEEMTNGIIDRMDTNAPLFQVPAFMSDVIVLAENVEDARWYKEVPTLFAPMAPFTQEQEYLVITMEFGGCEADPFAGQRYPVSKDGSHSTLLHPVIRHYRGQDLAGTHHVLQNMDNCWKEDRFIIPLRAFLTSVLDGGDDALGAPMLQAQSA